MNTNNKSTKKKPNPLKGGMLAAIERDIILNRDYSQRNNPRNPKRKMGVKKFDTLPQKRSPKSQTGASYNDGFDCISSPEKINVRSEPFDELIATVNGSVAFAITQFVANPGNPTSFPRLSRFAQLYEKYLFDSLEFYFQHDVSQFSAQGAQGLVILSSLYDAASSTPTSKSQVEVTSPHVICMPNQNSLLKLNPKRLHPTGLPLFVRGATLPGGNDVKTYDCANIFVTTQGMAGATEVGELHVRGRVRLMDEILDASTVSAPINNQITEFQSSGVDVPTSGVDFTLPLQTTVTNGLAAVNTAGSIVLPAGNYMISASVVGAGTGGSSFQLKLNKNATGLVNTNNQPSSVAAFTVASLSQSLFYTSNGTDALTVVINLTAGVGIGARGVLMVLAA